MSGSVRRIVDWLLLFLLRTIIAQERNFQKILTQSYDNVRIFEQCTLILRQIYDIKTIVQTLLTL